MNWFERHLNWTALGMAVGGAGLFTGVLFLSLGGALPFPENYFNLGSPRLIWLSILFLAFLVLSFLSYDWILRQKGRSSWFSAPFIVILGLYTVAAIYQSYFSDQHWFLTSFRGTNLATLPGFPVILLPRFEPPYPNSILIDPTITLLCLSLAVVYVIQWTYLICLRSQTPNKSKELFNRNPKRVMFIAGITFLCLGGASGLFFLHGYLHFDSRTEGPNSGPNFSCDYPASFVLSQWSLASRWQGAALLGLPYTHEIVFESISESNYESITIRYFPVPPSESTEDNPDIHFEYSTQTSMLLAGKPATLTLHIMRYEYSQFRDTYVTVMLNDNGHIWYITLLRANQELYEPPDDFIHLLETFTIYD